MFFLLAALVYVFRTVKPLSHTDHPGLGTRDQGQVRCGSQSERVPDITVRRSRPVMGS